MGITCLRMVSPSLSRPIKFRHIVGNTIIVTPKLYLAEEKVKVEALVIQGPKLATVMSQVKKLEVSVLVLGQKKHSSILSCLCENSGRSTEEVLANWSKEEKSRHEWIPYQHKVAKEFLATGLIRTLKFVAR
ncbi:hypothetical protein Lal_00019436 [Lupinus albus]|nr:hypothetical protein Lal_00019436 [Lupinus albus]